MQRKQCDLNYEREHLLMEFLMNFLGWACDVFKSLKQNQKIRDEYGEDPFNEYF